MDRLRKPIYSQFEDEPGLQDELNDFVVALAERVDSLQDAETHGSHDMVSELAHALAADAQKFGYPLLSMASEQVVEACREEKDDAVEEGLVEVTELARRIRLGHRGAA